MQHSYLQGCSRNDILRERERDIESGKKRVDRCRIDTEIDKKLKLKLLTVTRSL